MALLHDAEKDTVSLPIPYAGITRSGSRGLSVTHHGKLSGLTASPKD